MCSLSGVHSKPGFVIDCFFEPYKEAFIHLKKAFSLKNDWDCSIQIPFPTPKKSLKIDFSKRVRHLLAGSSLIIPFVNVIAFFILKHLKKPPSFPLKSPEELIKEFLELPSYLKCEDLRPHCKKAFDNFHLNNFNDNFPFDHNVCVHPCDPKFYYNASYVLNGKAIAAQAPIFFGQNEFWEMAWQSNSPVIVMLTNYRENNKPKCSQYFPYHPMVFPFGKIKVANVEESKIFRHPQVKKEKIVKRKLVLYKDGSNKEITHFHLKNWPDQKVAQKETLAFLVREISKHMRFFKQTKERTGPLITHCSAGIGRTGTFLAAYEGDKRIRKGEKPSGLVKKIALELRSIKKGRNGMIQTPGQYILVHEVLNALHPCNKG